MRKYTYERAGALVNIQTDDQKLTAEIRKGNDVINIELSRREKIEEITVRYDGVPYDESILRLYYDVNFTFGDVSKSFSVDFKECPVFNGKNLNLGIPNNEYKKLCEKIELEHQGAARVFRNYIYDEYGLENKLNQSAFNARLDDFLSK